MSSIMVIPLMKRFSWYPHYIFFQGSIFIFNLLFTTFFFLRYYLEFFDESSSYTILVINVVQILLYLLLSLQIYLTYHMLSGIIYKNKTNFKIFRNSVGILLIITSFISGIIGGDMGRYLALSIIFGVSQIPLAFLILKLRKIWQENESRLILIIPLAAIAVFPVMVIEYTLTGTLENSSSQLFTVPIGKISFTVFCYIIAVATLIHNIKIIFQQTNNISEDLSEISESFINSFNITKREQDIIACLKEGMGHKQIADKLHISTRTVGSHLSNIYKKCEVNSMVELLNCIEVSRRKN